MLKKFLVVMAFASVAMLAGDVVDAGCGGSGRVGLVQRVREHRQLNVEHRANNLSVRHARMSARGPASMSCPQVVQAVAPPTVPAEPLPPPRK